VDGVDVLLFWYRSEIFAIEARCVSCMAHIGGRRRSASTLTQHLSGAF